MSNQFIYYGQCVVCMQHGDKLPRDINDQRLCKVHARKPSPPAHTGMTQDLLNLKSTSSAEAIRQRSSTKRQPTKEEREMDDLMKDLGSLTADEKRQKMESNPGANAFTKPPKQTNVFPQIPPPQQHQGSEIKNRLKGLEAAAENQYNTAVQLASDVKRHSQKIAGLHNEGKKISQLFAVKQEIIQSNAEDIESLQANHRGVVRKIKQHEGEIATLKNQVANNTGLIKTIDKSLQAGAGKFEKLENALRELQKHPRLTSANVEELKSMVKNFNAKLLEINSLKEEVKQLQQSNEKLELTEKQGQEYLNKLKKLVGKLKDNRQQLLDKIAEYQKATEAKLDDFKTSSNATIDFILDLAKKIMRERNIQVENATKRTAKQVTKKLAQDNEKVNELEDAIKNLEESKFKLSDEKPEIDEINNRIKEIYQFVEKNLDEKNEEHQALQKELEKLSEEVNQLSNSVNALPKLEELKNAIAGEIEIPDDFVTNMELDKRLKETGDGLINKMQKITDERDTEVVKKHAQFSKDIQGARDRLEQIETMFAKQNASINALEKSQDELAATSSKQEKHLTELLASFNELKELIGRQAAGYAAVIEQNKGLLAHNRRLSKKIMELEGNAVLDFQQSIQ